MASSAALVSRVKPFSPACLRRKWTDPGSLCPVGLVREEHSSISRAPETGSLCGAGIKIGGITGRLKQRRSGEPGDERRGTAGDNRPKPSAEKRAGGRGGRGRGLLWNGSFICMFVSFWRAKVNNTGPCSSVGSGQRGGSEPRLWLGAAARAALAPLWVSMEALLCLSCPDPLPEAVVARFATISLLRTLSSEDHGNRVLQTNSHFSPSTSQRVGAKGELPAISFLLGPPGSDLFHFFCLLHYVRAPHLEWRPLVEWCGALCSGALALVLRRVT